MTILDPIKKDALQEIGNIGLGSAVTALSELTGETFLITVPEVRQLTTAEIPYLFGDPETIVVGAACHVEGDWAGHGAFLFGWESGCDLWTKLTGTNPETPNDISELHSSMVSEIANIMVAAYTNSIGEMTNFVLTLHPPAFVCDMSAAILSSLTVEAILSDRELLAVQTSFDSVNLKLSGTFMFLPDTGSLEKLFKALGIA